MVGAVPSDTETLNEQVPVLPLPSLAVKVTVVLPTPLKMVPAVGVCNMLGVLQLSALLTGLYAGKVAVQEVPSVSA